jgi:hypothetical protein
LLYRDVIFEITLEKPLCGVDFLGPTLRGLFGYALRDAACGHPSNADGYCTEPWDCPYSQIFEGQKDLPQPFVLLVDPPKVNAKRKKIQFGVRLFGSSMTHAPIVVRAFEIGESFGIGAERIKYRIAQANVGEPKQTRTISILDPSKTISLEWKIRTPLSLRDEHDLRTEPSADALVSAGRRRVWLMRTVSGMQNDLPMPTAPPHGTFRIVKQQIHEWRIFRNSGRQERTVPLRGIDGRMIIDGPWSDESWWLGDALSTNIGKHTSFGLGFATWEQLPAQGRWLRLPRWIRLRGFPPKP